MASDLAPAEAGPVSEWFWVVTVQRGLAVDTVSGCAVIPASDTRRDAYEGVMAEVRRRTGISPGRPVAVLFYSLGPMALADRRPS